MKTAIRPDTGMNGGVGFGARFGLYELLAAGPVSAREVADWSGLPEATVSRWLNDQHAQGYVVRDGADRFRCWSFIGQRP